METKALLLASHEEFASRDLLAARRLAEKALAQCTPSDPPQLLGQIRFHLGMVARELGDTSFALSQFRAFLEGATAHDGKARFYIALCLRQVGDYVGAVAEYKRVIAADASLAGAASDNIVWASCLAGDVATAKAFNVTTDLTTAKLNSAHIALVEGNYAAVTNTADDLLVGDDLTDEQKAQVAWLAGRAYLASGDLENAHGMSEIAAYAAGDYGDNRLMRDVAQLRHEIAARMRRGA